MASRGNFSGVQVFALEPGQAVPVQLPANSHRRIRVTEVLELGFGLIETPSGRRAMLSVAKDTIRELKADGQPCLYDTRGADPNFVQLPGVLDRFIAIMKSSPPAVHLGWVDAGEAATDRRTNSRWAATQNEREMQNFLPSLICPLLLHRNIIGAMCNTQNYGDIDTYRFQMAIAVAHEIIHYMTAYLTGDARVMTPDAVTAPGYGGPEAGQAWERQALGGHVEFFLPKSAPSNSMAPGIPIMFDTIMRNSAGRRVPTAVIQAFSTGNFVAPIQVNPQDPSQTRVQTLRMMRDMSEVRQAQRPTGPWQPRNSFRARSTRLMAPFEESTTNV